MRRGILAVVGGVLLAVAATTPVLAQNAPGLAVVDMERVGREYKGFDQIQSEYQQFAQEQQARFTARQKMMMLSEGDYTKYFDLIQAAAPTEANKKQIADLETLAATRQARLKELVALKERDATQTKEYDELSQLYQLRMAELQQLDEALMKDVQAKKGELTKKADAQVEAAVKMVAEQKKLSMVFIKAALLFGGTDITEDVLVKLNASAAPAPIPAAPAK